MAAILLDIDPRIGLDVRKGHVLGYPLYKPDNAERTSSQISLDLEKYLVDANVTNAATAPLVVHILLSALAPEFVVQQLPGSLTIGSPSWVTHTFTVAKLEAIASGSSRLMSYEHVLTYTDIEPFTEELEQLFGLIVVEPVLNWAIVNGIIPYSTEGEYTSDHFKSACARYDEYTEALEQCNDALSTPLPTRKEVALKELERVLPSGNYLTENDSYHADLGLDEGEKVSTLDVFMSGDLLSEGLTGSSLTPLLLLGVKHGPQIDGAEQYFHQLGNIKDLYTSAFNNYFAQLQLGLGTALKLALSKMPLNDRIPLEYGVLSFYTVRKKFADAHAKETQRARDKFRGRYGIIICSEYQTKRHYYELFTLRAECFKRQDLKRVFETTDIEYREPSITFDKNEEQWQRQHLEWPLDIDAYLTGSEPVKSKKSWVVVEKLWQSYERERVGQNTVGALHTFFSERTQDIAKKVLEYCPPAKHEELYAVGYGVTALEAARKNREDNVEMVLNLIIPFKSCVEDLTSGDPDRKTSGIVGCALDGLAIVGAVVGAVPKLTGIALKSTSLLTKSLKLVRFSGSFALSLINPLDGVPSLMKKGANLTRNGVLLITKQGYKTCSKATGQLRTLSGTLDTFNAAKSLKNPSLIPAYLESIGDLSQATDVLLVKRGRDWYQLELNTFEPRGPKVVNFKTDNL